jgi:hypothetical protein
VTNERPPAPRARNARRWRIIGAILAVPALIVGCVAMIDVLSDDPAPNPDLFNAGEAELYERGDVNVFDSQRVLLTRLANGDFLAFYDWSPKQQEIGNSGCRVRFDENARLSRLSRLDDIDGAFVEECEGVRTVWRADGQFDSGGGYGDLDEFQVIVTDGGTLLVDLSERRCTKSRGVPGIPPFDVRRCDGPGL